MSKRSMEPQIKKKRYIAIGIVVLLLLLIPFLLFLDRGEIPGNKPALTIETPQKINPSETKEIMLDVTLSSLGEALYPAASMSILFDASRLEFMGVEEGNVFIRNSEENVTQKLPDWSCNPKQCNKTGKINIMYLDLTGGKNAFSNELLAKEENVVVRLRFRLRGSARKGDVYDLIFEDAVFAASDENESLAMTTGTLKVRNGKIVVGE